MAEAEGASPSTSLSDIFGSVPQHGVENDPSAVENEPKSEAKDEGDQKFPVSVSSPPEDKSDEKSDESEEDDKQEAEDDKPASDKPEEKKAESKEKEEKPPTEEKAAPKDKWESDENPFFKRYRDTAANWNKEHQQNLQLQNQLTQMQQETTVLRKMVEGTYDPEKDDPRNQVTHEMVAARASDVGKAVASRHAAVEQFGAEKVDTELNEFHQRFGKNPLIQQLVMSHDAPVYEAMRIVDRFRFEEKYGSTPDAWKKSIREEVEKELTAKLTAEITEKLMGRADKKKSTPTGLHSSRGSNGMGSSQNSKGKGPTPLKSIFG